MNSISQFPIVVVGPFPPPTHGMSTTNAVVCEHLRALGVEPQIIDTGGSNLERHLLARLGRLPKVLRGLVRLAGMRQIRGASLYISISGGFGQVYDTAFIVIARVRGMRVAMRHCSFAYLDEPTRRIQVLTTLAGRSAIHVTQSQGMAERLKAIYGMPRVMPISNAVLYPQEQIRVRPRRKVATLGFLSNLSVEKGIHEFLDLMATVEGKQLPLTAKIAGPFQDARTEAAVRARLDKLHSVEYVGPVYDSEKNDFLESIDVLVFPTRYKHETEAKVNHEAMSRGIPVIAYGRGCIPEIVSSDGGKVIDPAEPFVPAALAQLEAWLGDPVAFQAASQAAARRFAETYAQSHVRWQSLLNELAGGTVKEPPTQAEKESASSQD